MSSDSFKNNVTYILFAYIYKEDLAFKKTTSVDMP